jgi:hypothetical protein
MVQMTCESMMTFAENWIAAWNRRDVDAVLAHFADDAQFMSPVARNFVGRPVLRNKQELADYWRAALDRISILEFRLDHATWDERCRELNVVYEANLNGRAQTRLRDHAVRRVGTADPRRGPLRGAHLSLAFLEKVDPVEVVVGGVAATIVLAPAAPASYSNRRSGA